MPYTPQPTGPTPDEITQPALTYNPYQQQAPAPQQQPGFEQTTELGPPSGPTPQPGEPVAVIPNVPYPGYPGPQTGPQAGPPTGQSYFEFETMPITAPQRRPKKPTPPRDPLAVAVGNGSLFGVGYGMLGRWWFAVVAFLVSVGLVVVLATTVRTLWLELIVVAWWVAVVAHGWVLARRKPQPEVPRVRRNQRFAAAAFALPVLLVFGFLRFDAAMIESDVDTAKQNGECAAAVEALDSRWFGHRVANAPMTARTDETLRACGLLSQASRQFNTALSGNTDAFTSGLNSLRTVLAELPGHENMVKHTLDQFLDRLPTKNACDTATLTDQLRSMKANSTALDGAAKVVPEVAPDAIVQCGDDLMKASEWAQAKDRYQQLLDDYPDHKLKARAQEGVTKATHAIELAKVRALLTPKGSAQPAYCTNPAPYSAAPAYGAQHPNRSLLYGADEYANRFPPDWKAGDAADAVLIICANPAEFGAPVETCTYRSFATGAVSAVTFHRIVIPVRVIELRTGKVVRDARVEIGGVSCPDVISGMETGMFVQPSDGDVHAGFAPIVW